MANFNQQNQLLEKKEHIVRKTDVYSVDKLHEMIPLFNDIYEAAKVAGLDVETVISEYAPGQFELTLKHQSKNEVFEISR